MIKEALQYIVGLNVTEVKEINGKKYTDKQVFPVVEPCIHALEVSTLESIVEYITKNPDGLLVSSEAPFIIHVEDYSMVSLKSVIHGDFHSRHKLLRAADNTKQFSFGQWYDREKFNIALQSQFFHTQNLVDLISVVSHVEASNGVQTTDDGMSQKVTAKTGVATLSNVVIPNPLKLQPYRTFPEVEQPESLFVFRMNDNMNCSLHEADGGKWNADCVSNIKEWFQFSLKEQIEAGTVVILA